MQTHRFTGILALVFIAACARTASVTSAATPVATKPADDRSPGEPMPDPRVGLRGGLRDAGAATWNLRVVAAKPRPDVMGEGENTDLAFVGKYAIQGNYHGWQIWDISDPSNPTLRTAYVCPASQSDVSVYRNLLFVSGEDLDARVDCGAQGVKDTVSSARLRGLRIFDISDIDHPRNVGNVQTCRGSHTHSLLVDERDTSNVYVYISGSSSVRSPSELPGCSTQLPEENAKTALFRIEVIKVPLAHPESAAIVSSPRIFDRLPAPARHGDTPEDIANDARALADAKAHNGFTAYYRGGEHAVSDRITGPLLQQLVEQRGGSGAPTAADTALLRSQLQRIIDEIYAPIAPGRGPTQCHDITLYPAIHRAGGACEGYGMLLDISDPAHPTRIAAVADSNFSYWHSASFNNDGSRILFSDEWGGGRGAKCRAGDPRDWGADAIFTIRDGNRLSFENYYKLPAVQTPVENCVAHNGSLIPVPGRDILVQAWYQGGISVFDWTDPSRPREIAFFDRGPIDSTRLTLGGSWSAYWYNGVIVSSEIARGLDILELTPSPYLSQNEIDAANTIKFTYWNTQGQQKFEWPASFSLARAYVDQLQRSGTLAGDALEDARESLTRAEAASGSARRDALNAMATKLSARSSTDAKLALLIGTLHDLAK